MEDASLGIDPPPVPVHGTWVIDSDGAGRSLRSKRRVETRRLPEKRQQLVVAPPAPELEAGHAKTSVEFCVFYQSGCCWYDDECYFSHGPVTDESGYKMTLCERFLTSGHCSAEDCFDSHGRDELRTPKAFQGLPGFKVSLCTWYVLEDLTCEKASHQCWDAHGKLDLRCSPVALPPQLKGASFTFSDAHLHLDQVLLARRYGSNWMYKRSICTHRPCLNPWCLWAHGSVDQRPRLRLGIEDLADLAEELNALAGGTFGGCVHSSCEVQTIDESVELVDWGRECMAGRLYVSFGIHPTNFEAYTPEVEAQIEAALERCGPQAVAWGECGLDYYHRTSTEDFSSVRKRMFDAFTRQARAAVRLGLPLVVHSRDAEEDTIDVLRENVPRDHPVYLHSYTGLHDAEMLTTFLAEWPHSVVGIAGAISYLKATNLHSLARALPLDRILLETDGPYMPPEPYRYQHSHPGHIPWIAEGVARAKGISVAAVLSAAHANFMRFYRLNRT